MLRVIDPQVKANQKRVGLEVSEAIAHAVKLANVDVVAAYPITPQTHIIESIAEMVTTGELHSAYIPVESEHSAMTARAVKATADMSGFTDIIEKAGGHLLVDSCPLNFNLDTTKAIANDSAKMTHYIMGMKGWENMHYGTMEECINAAISGKWEGELR